MVEYQAQLDASPWLVVGQPFAYRNGRHITSHHTSISKTVKSCLPTSFVHVSWESSVVMEIRHWEWPLRLHNCCTDGKQNGEKTTVRACVCACMCLCLCLTEPMFLSTLVCVQVRVNVCSRVCVRAHVRHHCLFYKVHERHKFTLTFP